MAKLKLPKTKPMKATKLATGSLGTGLGKVVVKSYIRNPRAKGISSSNKPGSRNQGVHGLAGVRGY